MILDEIVATKRREIERAKSLRSSDDLYRVLDEAGPVRDFFAPLAASGPIRLIAEIKKASPSKGVIRENFEPVEIAHVYAAHGANCISVLTDETYFQGKLETLASVRAAVSLPLLRKDFILDSYQLLEARVAGADAVLLIAECLDDCMLPKLYNESLDLGLTPLVELYEFENLSRVLDLGATLVGVNNRNLKTFEVNLEHVLRVRDKVPADCVLVAESGVHTRADVERLEAAGIDAMLVGEGLLKEPDVGAAVNRLLGRAPA